MASSNYLHRVAKKARRLLQEPIRARRLAFREGLPEGLEFSSLDDCCRRHFGHPLRSVSYQRLSGWKTTCKTYRLFVRLKKGPRRSLVFKRAEYHRGLGAPLAELPASPGVPEYTIYKHANGPLAKYLPEVYSVIEKIPGQSYQYLLEDLAGSYQQRFDMKGVSQAIDQLSGFQRALSGWAQVVDGEALIQYDAKFTRGLQRYAEGKFRQYVSMAPDSPMAELLILWPEISSVHLQRPDESASETGPIHGDFNITNIHFHRQNPTRIKLVDWEWAGFGFPHADLASLLPDPSLDVEDRVLARVSGHDTGISSEAYRRIYQWCQLERGILDTAFVAAQALDPDHEYSAYLQSFLEISVGRTMRAYRALI